MSDFLVSKETVGETSVSYSTQAVGIEVQKVSAVETLDLTQLLIKCITEMLGMFIFIFLSLGGVQSALKTNANELSVNPTLAFIEIAMCFGFGLSAAIFFSYRISGGALNPAVNFGLFVAGVMDPITLAAYTIAQMAGASIACGIVSVVFPGDFKGANQIFAGTSVAQAFFLELILTAGLVLIVLFLAVEKSKITFYAPMVIGTYVFIAHLLAIPYTNTSINPARSFGASIASGIWNDHWLFWVAPLLGASLSGALYRFYKFAEYHTLNPGQDADH
ncbi:aquaporin-like protein [Rhizoclosmatium globosum]|uniref:Aquaporin-like protein n=1 Tax=Rhizoclosmatium globosum TaxID=329046 RepID=A0A1Y2CVP1_9FUNG|nr:aquaporin-like protein [Rhizoclosmatium globosum]|eukprot:ORY50884.1 aquaporin-like protein [Rhizoclosmatium globosum]